MMGRVEHTVVVTGVAGPLGRRVLEELGGLAERRVAVDAALDPSSRGGRGSSVRVAPFALGDARLASAVAGADVVVHLGPASGPELDGTGGDTVDLDGFGSFLDTLEVVGQVSHLVVLSTALVYGSSEDNPVPLTEDAPLRPDPRVRFAGDKARLEVMARAWADEHGATCTVLRTAVVVGPGNGRWLARSPWSTSGIVVRRAEPPVQFLHVDDLASAVRVAVEQRLDGVVNVAPDGWLPGEQVRALKGPTIRIRLPWRVAYRLARLGAVLGSGRGSPAAVVAASGPCVVANDRLRETGWLPRHTSAEAFVAADPGGPWTRLTPRHRQSLALGGIVAAVGSVVAVAAVLVLRRRRRR
jgi:nucleoside-diphosphate-sugar epimerase